MINQQQERFKAVKGHTVFVFDTLINTLHKKPEIAWPANLPSASSPLFVSYYYGKEKYLRGCIGTFSNLDIKLILKEYALNAAFKDPRFKPISASEVPELTVEVSFLTDFEDVQDIWDW